MSGRGSRTPEGDRITATTYTPELIAKRYSAEALLGRGGAGEVHRVRDKANGSCLALKRLHVPESEPKRGELELLFEREYHTLAQLAHPCIVEVYDYGVSDGKPYYTMELLDGSDLRELAPLPWQRACALLCDVASSLALLHSRRLVHRDLSPRNVRCTSAGRAKLIDFGAMAAMGRSGQLIGTPAYVAPELANGQELDGRADLYGLGALAYWTLTGRHAFRARHFNELRELWRVRPAAPSAFARDVPPDLDALVMALLSLDPAARPSSTAEVSCRLRALSGQAADDTIATAHAYLTTPTLVGRSDEQRLIQRRTLRAVRGSGGSMLIEGAAGSGRSRLLATLVLEAKLAGALVLSTSVTEADPRDYGVLQRLVSELLQAAPELCQKAARPHASFIAAALPELELASPPSRAPDGEVRESLISFLLDIAQVQPLCVAVDDLPRADPASAVVLARLATHAHDHALLVAATAESGRQHALVRALDQLAESGARLVLPPLDADQSGALLRSVFGDVPNLAAVSDWIYALSTGRPGSCMELAQHLVDRGVARFADGGWTLTGLDQLSLPVSFEQALEQRIAALSPCARELCELLSQSLPLAPLKLAECLELLAPRFGNSQAFHALDELLFAQLLLQTGDAYRLRDEALRALVDRGLAAERRRELNARLAHSYERRGGAEAIVGYHFMHAGEWERGFEIHSALRDTNSDLASLNVLFGRSEAGVAALETLYRTARERGLSPAKLYPLQKLFIQLAAIYDPALVRYADDVLPQLRKDSGWIHWPECADLPAFDRIVRCVQLAQQRYERTPEAERGLAPADAIRELAVTVGVMSAVFARTADPEGAAQLPGLLEPFATLTPVIGLLHEMTVSVVESVAHASYERDARDRVIERLARPVDGLDEITRQGTVNVLNYYQGLDAAIRAEPAALERVEQLAALPSYAALAAQVRMIYCLTAGDLAGAESAREQREALALRQLGGDSHLICGLIYELGAVTITGDLVAAQRLVERIGREAERFPGWRPWHALAGAMFESLRGNVPAALREVERCLAVIPASGHATKDSAHALEAELLIRSGEPARALEIARGVVTRRAAEGRLINHIWPLQLALAHAETLCGEYAQGAARLDALIGERETRGQSDLILAVLYVQRARIALCAGDQPAFERFAVLATRCNDQLRHPGLLARLQQLVADARNADQPVTLELARGADVTVHDTVLASAIELSGLVALDGCLSAGERTRRALDMLIREAGASGGYLFAATPRGMQALAFANVPAPDGTLERLAADQCADASSDDEIETRIEHSPPSTIEHTAAERPERGLQPFVLRGVRARGRMPSGVALLLSHDGRQLRLRWDLLGAVCESLLRAGDFR